MGALSVRYSERLVTRFGAARVLLVGLLLIGAGLACSPSPRSTRGYVADVLPATVLLGIGAGLGFPPLMGLAMSGVPPSDAGPGVRAGQHHRPGRRRARAGGAGHAVDRADERAAGGGTRVPRALTGGYHAAFWIAVVLILAALATALTVLRPARAAPVPPVEPVEEELLPVAA